MSEPIQPVSATPSKPKKRWTKGLWWRIPVCLIGLITLLSAIAGAGGSKSAALPTCDSSIADGMVKNAIKNGPLSKILNVEILALKDTVTKSATEEKVECHATGLTNAGETKFNFSFQWVNKDKGQYIVHVTEDI